MSFLRGSIEVRPSLAAGLVLVCLASVAFLVEHRGGPDFGSYMQWCRVFSSGDIFAIQSAIATPTGLPMTQWSPGPGLLMAPPYAVHELLATGGPELTRGDLRFAGMLGVGTSALTWLGVLLLLSPAAKKTVFAAIAALLTIFYGSHAGYYSHHHSSESLALLLVVWLAVFLQDADYQSRWKAAAFVVIGCLLIICRLKMAPVVGAFFFAWAYGGYRVLEPRRRIQDAATAFALLLMVAAIVGTSNEWMTGSWFTSPYAIGDEQFRTADFLRPRFLAEILLHSWHGLLVYHPLYAVGVGFLCARALRGKLTALQAVALFAFVYILYLHAGWFCWWLGRGSFGMRATAPISVLLMLPIVDNLARRQSRPLALVVGIGVFWSLLLHLQGDSNFYSYPALLAGQWKALTELLQDLESLAPLGVAGAVLAATWLLRLRGSGPQLDASLQRIALPFAASVLALSFVASGFLFARAARETSELMARDDQWARREFREVNHYNRQAVLANLRAYDQVEGYEDEKDAIRAFLDRNPGVPYRVYVEKRDPRLLEARGGKER